MTQKDTGFRGDKSFGVTLDKKALNDEGEFEGYGAIFGNEDRGGDIIAHGAFEATLKERPANKIKMLLHHDTRKPVGVWSQIYTDRKGLYVRGRILRETDDGRNAYELVKAGALDGLSIGYRSVEDNYDSGTSIRTITKLDLWEVSLVTFPMNTMAGIENVKDMADRITNLKSLAEAEKLLREAGGFSRKQATDLVSVVKRIAQREAGADQDADIKSALEALKAKMLGA